MKTKLTLLAIFISLTAFSQAPNWEWAKCGISNKYSTANQVAVDNSGNHYVAGGFSDTLIFDSDTLVTGPIYRDMYLVKYDLNGNVLWAKSGGGSTIEYANTVTTDAIGNVYIAGIFESDTMFFGTDTFLINANATGTNINLFFAKYDSTGNLKWAKKAGNISGANGDEATSATCDAFGNVYLTGDFESQSITFDSITLWNSYNGGPDVFLVKYDTSGNVEWARKSGANSNSGYQFSLSVASDIFGNVCIAGWYANNAIFGTDTLMVPIHTGIFLSKYDSLGNELWAKSPPGSGGFWRRGNSVVTDGLGNIYMAGSYDDASLTFDTITISNFSGYEDMFIVKYDGNGNAIWAHNGTANIGQVRGISLTNDLVGNIYLAGDFGGSITFGSTTFVNNNNSNGYFDLFIVKYTDSGNLLWAKSTGGIGLNVALSITNDAFQNIYITGIYSDTVLFDQNSLIQFNNTTNNNSVMFVAKICGLCLSSSISSTDFCASSPCSGTATITAAYGTSPYLYSWSNSQTTQTITGLCAGTYSVFVVDANNDSTTASVTITNIPLPTVTFNQVQTNMCVNWGVRTLTAGSPSGGTYSGTAVVGNTFNATNAGTGIFPIVYSYTDLNGCTNADTSYITVNACLGIESNENNFQFSISPNPSSGRFIIESEITKGEIEIYNTLGEKIYSSEIISNKAEIDLSDKAKGIYFIKIQSEGKISSRKIVIE